MKKPTSAPLRLLAYARVSTESQADRGVSLADQEVRLKAYAAAIGAELVAVICEQASGRLSPDRRPELAKILSRVRAGEVDGVLVLRLDRLTRRMKDAVSLLDESSRKGWRLLSVQESLDTGSPVGRFVANLMASLAALEAEQVSERTRAGLAQVAREGRARSGRLPYGWRNADGREKQKRGDRRRLVPHDGEQKTLRRMLSLNRKGLGACAVATRLNAAKVPSRSGRPWTMGNTRSILATAGRRAEILS